MIGQYTEILPTRHGHMIVPRCDSHIYGAFAAYGESTQQEIDCCLQFIKAGDTVLDVGANIGTFAIPFALAVGKAGNVIAIEPQRLPYMCLCGNIALNSMVEYVQPVRAGVGAAAGLATIPLVNPWVQSNNIGGTRLNSPAEVSDSVPLITIDSLKLESLNFLKIDVEGMEYQVLAGASETIERCQPAIFAECMPEDAENKSGLIAFFKQRNYQVRQLISPLYSSRNLRLNTFNGFGEQYDWNVIAVPDNPPAWFNDLRPLE